MNYLWFTLLSAFWGGSFVAIKLAVTNFPPFMVAFFRVSLSLILLWLFFLSTRKKLAAPYSWRWKMWCVGLFSQAIPFIFLFWGQRYISAGLGGILNGTVPIWAFILSPFFVSNNDFSINKVVGLFLGMIGILIIFSPMLKISGEWHELLGSLALLGMALSYAIGGLLNQKFFAQKRELFHANIFHQHCSSVLLLFLVSITVEKWPPLATLMSPSLWLAVGYLAIFSTAIAWIMYFWLIQEWGAVRASTVTYVAPIMAIVWDFVFFHNIPPITQVFGIATILMGVILIQVPRAQWRQLKILKIKC